MSPLMLTLCTWLATLLYIGQAGVLFYTKQYGHALMFAGYTLANFGIIWAILRGS